MPTLNEVFSFSHETDFPLYQKWHTYSEKSKNDPSLKLSLDELEHLEAWETVQNIYERVLPDAVSVLNSYKDTFKAEFKKYEDAVKNLENQNKLFEFYKSVLDRLTKLYLESLSQMLTEIYGNVYNNPLKSVQLDMTDFRGKKIVKVNIINNIDGKCYVEDLSLEGGAATIMLGAIVAVYFIMTVGLPRIIFFDECFSQLHDDTLARFLSVLRQFVDQLGFTFVIVAHDAYRMRGFINKAYVVDNGVYKEVSSDGLEVFLESTVV